MNLNRVSKKLHHEDNRMTMLAIHENKINEIKKYYETLPDKEKKLEALKRQNKKKNIDSFSLNKQINELTEEISNIKSQTELTEYLLKASFYLKEYKNEVNANNNSEVARSEENDTVKKKKKKEESDSDEEDEVAEDEIEGRSGEFTIIKSNKGIISNNYIQNCLGNNFSGHITAIDLKCENCGIHRIINNKEAIAVCTECGSIIDYQSTDACNEFSEEIEVLSPFSYKRINHLKEWISMILARETTSPPQEVIDTLLLELKKDRITDSKQVTKKRIKAYLKKHGLHKQYEHIPAIIYKICGTQPPTISRELENKIIKMFDEMQIPHDKYKNSNRKNFLSYSYSLNKLALILGENELASYFPLLKSRDKLYEQDRLFEKICKDLGWKFYPSV
jgi:hypothetical protein